MFETKEGIVKPIVYVGFIKKSRLLLVDYDIPPNPSKTGWWIPAPGLKFGENPQDCAKQVASDLGLEIKELSLKGVESFVLPGGWHLITHYLIQTDSEPTLGANIKEAKWVSAEELSTIKNTAHGKWEIELGLRYLDAAGDRARQP